LSCEPWTAFCEGVSAVVIIPIEPLGKCY